MSRATKLQLAKVQFLADADKPLRTFRRKRAHVLFDKAGDPVRVIEWDQWVHLRKTWPDLVAKDGLTAHTIWTLVETTVKVAA